SERTVRNLEVGRVRSPRTHTVRLLADALALTGPERQNWVAAAQGANRRQAQAGPPGAGAPAQLLRRVTVAVLTAHSQHVSGPALTRLIGEAGQTVLVIHCAHPDAALYPPTRLTPPAAQPPQLPFPVSSHHQFHESCVHPSDKRVICASGVPCAYPFHKMHRRYAWYVPLPHSRWGCRSSLLTRAGPPRMIIPSSRTLKTWATDVSSVSRLLLW